MKRIRHKKQVVKTKIFYIHIKLRKKGVRDFGYKKEPLKKINNLWI